jgi:lipid II:glycine glycyltransferase (peptidoglycan interpeptide bridge formation enzyme)
MPQVSPNEWDAFISRHPEAHLLQTGAWGELKSAFGWTPVHILSPGGDLGAQVLFRRLPLGLLLAYIPKGPVGSPAQAPEARSRYWPALWEEVDQLCRERGAVFLKIEPDGWIVSDEEEIPPGFRPGPQQIQPRRTLLVDLSGDEAAILARMKQKTRYNIRLAQKKGVQVFPSDDLDSFHGLMQVTGQRDAFGVHSLAYYRRAYELFYPRGECELFLARLEGEALGGLMVFAHGPRAWYFYGASSDQQREAMPTYLLQWEAMRWARGCGCSSYDLWGVPDADEQSLEAQFTQRADGLWGVYRFKRGFGGQLRRAQGPWDRIYRPAGYALYRLGLRLRPAEAG